MAFQYSTGFKNAVLDTNSVKTEFEGMKLKLYGGAIPENADAAETGTLLCTIAGPSGVNLDLAAAASGGQIEKLSSQAWSGDGLAAASTGTTATHFRLETSSDTQAESTTEKRIQGTVGTTGGYDLQMANATIIEGDSYTIDFFVLAFLGGC